MNEGCLEGHGLATGYDRIQTDFWLAPSLSTTMDFNSLFSLQEL